MRVQSLFVSDVHLGCRFSRAGELFDFLGRFEPENLFLVGDIIDGWKLRRNFAWGPWDAQAGDAGALRDRQS